VCSSDLPGPNNLPLSVTVHGPYSTRYRDILRKRQQARLMTATKGGLRRQIDMSDIEDDTEQLMVGCIEAWNMSFEGEDVLDLTPDNISDVFKQHPWVRDQISAVLMSAADFLEPPKLN
jgi:hypothetical protein